MITVNTKPCVNSSPIQSMLSTHALVFHSNKNESLITRHNVIDGKISRGVVLQKSQLVDLLSKSIHSNTRKNKDMVVRDFIPNNVLIDNHQILAWFKPSEEKTFWFSIHGQPVRSYRIKTPNLVFKVNKDKKSLSICAVASKSRPSLTTKIYVPPIMNTSSNGSFCLGAARLPRSIEIQNISACEASVFDSQFTHFNTGKVIKGVTENSDYFSFLKEKESSKKPFYARELYPMMNKSLKEFLS